MQKLEKLFFFLFPDLLASNSPWSGMWRQKQKQDFVFTARILFSIIAIVYITHYYFVDIPLKKTPLEHWFKFRFGMASVALLSLGFYSIGKLHDNKFYKIPQMLALWLVCYTQARVTIWFPQAPYWFAAVFVYLSAVLLKSSALKSSIYASCILVTVHSSFLEAGVLPNVAWSTYAVVLCMIVLSRTGYISELKYFLSSNENIDSQKKLIEMNIEFTDQIKAFLPKEIAKRLEFYMSQRKMSVLQAADEVLRARKRTVSCLFSDIRGFTRGSKDLENFVQKSVLPNVKGCTKAVEKGSGIPRKIGDLIFAYYDNKDIRVNVINTLASAIEMAKFNHRFNKSQLGSEPISRHYLVSTGEAIVGNLGGFDSSIEITALGTPVNFLSRLDEITKLPEVKSKVSEMDLILDKETVSVISDMNLDLDLKRLDLKKLKISIRDFEDVHELWVLPVNTKNETILLELFNMTQIEEPQGVAA